MVKHIFEHALCDRINQFKPRPRFNIRFIDRRAHVQSVLTDRGSWVRIIKMVGKDYKSCPRIKKPLDRGYELLYKSRGQGL